MTLVDLCVLALIQGLCELLPVSSSAHVILAERLFGLDPTTPEMTLLLVMLHTGTMFAVIVYFWADWKQHFFSSRAALREAAVQITLATAATAVIGLLLLKGLEHLLQQPGLQPEQLFGNTRLIAGALAAVGVLIIVAGLRAPGERPLGRAEALTMGAVQGLCLPFRGFSRSGATISSAMLMRVQRSRAEAFSFAMAVVLTPPLIVRQVLRLIRAQAQRGPLAAKQWLHLATPSLAGAVLAFLAGLLALRWLSAWLEHGRWHYFGIYCLCLSVVVFVAG
ncbi:UDP-diphosphatase [beta proteobacterium AAP99]|nr:UDP-diphosphatase [beta proteobacterium AAP99]